MLSPAALEVVTNQLRVISEPTRVRLMLLLDDLKGATVQELCDEEGSTYQNVSRHLIVLWNAGLLSRTRVGHAVRYELMDWTPLWVVQQIASSVSDRLDTEHQQFHA